MAKQTDTLEQKVVAFAEQLGRVIGDVQNKAEGLMDRDAVNAQIADVRATAAELIAQMKAAVTRAPAKAAKARKLAGAKAPSKNKGRSGGVVDAPGKKHRKPAPRDPRAMAAKAMTASMRSAKASMKTMKRRGRG